jgi:hypothetical protein
MKKQLLATQKKHQPTIQWNNRQYNEKATNNVVEQPRAKKRALSNNITKQSNWATHNNAKTKKKNEKNKKTIQQEKNDVQNYIKRNPLEIFVCLGVNFFIELTQFSNYV